MAAVNLFNPNTNPTTYDTEGHVAPGMEHVVGDDSDPVTKQLLDEFLLVGTPVLPDPQEVAVEVAEAEVAKAEDDLKVAETGTA